GPAGTTGRPPLNGPQPLPVQAATITSAAPAGTGSVSEAALYTSRAATVSAPPPGPAPGWTTNTWYHSAPAIALQLVVRLFAASTVALITDGACDGTGAMVAVNCTGALHGPQATSQARTRS